MSEPTKWVCEYCTYENFTAALKCTMCRGFKPLLNEDIYRLRDESPTSRDDVLRTPSSGGNCNKQQLNFTELINAACSYALDF